MKDAILQMLATALDRKGTPLTVVWADPNTTLLDPNQANPNTNNRGVKAGIRADAAAHEAFKNIHNDSVIVLPGKKDSIFSIEAIQQQGSSDVFMPALDFCNKSIMRALLIPSLVFTNGDGSGSYALGQEHAKTFERILDSWLAGLKQVLLQQVIKEALAYNFPKSVWEKDGVGDFARRELSQEERSREADMYEKAINAGIVDQGDIKDLNKMRDTLGFEARQTPIQKPTPFDGGFDDGNDGNGLDTADEQDAGASK